MSRDLAKIASTPPPLRVFQVAKVEYVKRKPKLKEVFVRLEDHLECMCTSQHHVVEHSEAETGKAPVLNDSHSPHPSTAFKQKNGAEAKCVLLPSSSSHLPVILHLFHCSSLSDSLFCSAPNDPSSCSYTDRCTCEAALLLQNSV